ncbi:DNA methyltransferase [Flavobacterium phragmitis]|uniref:Methyltransferase n=1 Tax=Flavobacterium phragmitis TaxID=739143 RepID=A0A1I1RTS0_9FLAO|nr:DNA methyltransferase [Flavobacterium phragmitis]SFD37754.1 DNA methylase [Flavobacterium phragmitis]
MINIGKIVKGRQAVESRWSKFGPYYAMFPIDFAFNVVKKYSKKGDYIIDPFAGRGSSIFAGGVLERHSLGIEINPVGWLYGSTKLNPAEQQLVLDRLTFVYKLRNHYTKSIEKLPEFYRFCYCDEVLKFLLAARKNLNWQTDKVDATLMSIIIVYLHGKLGEGLSNQMRMTKSMGMNYSIQWWKEKGYLHPPEINPLEFITKKIKWRYKNGTPKITDSSILFGDSSDELEKIAQSAKEDEIKFSLLFTSPPYWSITDYYADQWLRLWMLGESAIPKSNAHKHKGRFGSKVEYYNLLDKVFGYCSKIMNEERSTIYIRTDVREYTFNTTLEILKKHFPFHTVAIKKQPFKKKTQTEIHGNSSKESGEVDIILTHKVK